MDDLRPTSTHSVDVEASDTADVDMDREAEQASSKVERVQPPPYVQPRRPESGTTSDGPSNVPVGGMVRDMGTQDDIRRGKEKHARNQADQTKDRQEGNKRNDMDNVQERKHARIMLGMRILQWLLGLIAFSIMASVTGYSNVKSFQYLLAMGIIVFVLNLPLCGVEWFLIGISYEDEEREVTRVRLYRSMPKINVIYDAIVSFLCFGAACAAAGVTSDPPPGLTACNGGCSNARAAVAMMFLLAFALVGSLFLGVAKLRKQMAEDAAVLPVSTKGTSQAEAIWQHNFTVGFVLRTFQWVLALVSFACFLSLDNNADFSAIQFAIAIGIIIFIFAFILMGFELYGRMQNLEYLPLGLGSWLGSLMLLGYDVVFALLSFGSACAAAGVTSLDCSVLPFKCSVGRAGVGLMFATWFFTWGSIYISYKDHDKAIMLKELS